MGITLDTFKVVFSPDNFDAEKACKTSYGALAENPQIQWDEEWH
jgi:hypothetical protein